MAGHALSRRVSSIANSSLKNLTTMPEDFTSVPVIDFSLALSPETKPRFLLELRDAVVRVGFLFLKNHPISKEVAQQLALQSKEFFDLPTEEKLDIAIANNKHFLGYVGFAAKSGDTIDHRETFTLGVDQPAPKPDEPIHRNLRGPNPWPAASHIPGFRQAVGQYMEQVQKLADDFKTLMEEALDLEPNSLARLFDETCSDRLMMAKYPLPASPPGYDSGFQGIGAHKDSSFLTFLLPGTPHTSLEVQNKSGSWIPANPPPGQLVINIGRQLEALTKGVCTATTHRVSLHPRDYHDDTGRFLGPRYTFPYFQLLGLDLTTETAAVQIPTHIADLVKDERVKSDANSYFQKQFKHGLGKGVFAARALRHPLAAQKFYPGLLEELAHS